MRFYIWPLIFFLALLSFLPTLMLHYTDEWYYINSVLLMVKNGDYLAPHNAYAMADISGILRFNKPILTYWAILAGFKIFGISVFSLRISFLLAGALTLVLTALMAQALFAQRERSDLASLILITQVGFLSASIRAIPDILVVLFLTLSAYGVFCLLSAHARYRLGWWCFYLGAALAIESKGLLGVVFIAYTWIFLWIMNPQIFAQRRITHVCAAFTGVLLAAAWYAAMWLKYGDIFIQGFLNDQIGLRIHHAFWLPLFNIPKTALVLGLYLLPWSAVALYAAINQRGFFQSITPARLRIYRFVIGWTLVMVIIIGLGNNISSRYLLPLVPLWAIITADIILQSTWEWRQRLGRYFLWIMIVVLILVGIIDFFIVGQLASITMGILVLMIFFGVGAWLIVSIRKQSLNFLNAAAILFFFLIASTACPLSLIVLPEAAQQITNSLEVLLPDGQKNIDFVGSNRLASNIRLLSQGDIEPEYLLPSEALTRTSHLPLLISAKDAHKLHLPNPNQKKIVLSRSLEDKNIAATGLMVSIFTWKLADEIQRQSQEFWLITGSIS